MSSLIRELKSLHGEAQSPDTRPTLERAERIVQLLCQLKREQPHRTDRAPLVLGPDSLASQLESLRLGSPPENLAGELRQLWAAAADEWASPSTLQNLTEEAARLVAPHSRSESDLQSVEEELAAHEEQLETLRLLADLLDELLATS